MMLEPILFISLEEIARLIGLIRKGQDPGQGAQGYYFDWNPCNQFDAATRPPGPNADIYMRMEEPQDEELGQNGGMLDNHADFTIEVQFRYLTPPVDPIWQGTKDLLRCNEDLKRFFGHKREALGAKGVFDLFRPKGVKGGMEYTNDRTNPVKLISPWRIHYVQDAKAPEIIPQ